MAETTRTSTPFDLARQRLTRDISKFIKDKVGKGPDSLEIDLNKNQAICFFKGFLSKAEELLVKAGDENHVCYARRMFKKHCSDELDAIFVNNINRKIKYFFDSYLPDQDVACWIIFFE